MWISRKAHDNMAIENYMIKQENRSKGDAISLLHVRINGYKAQIHAYELEYAKIKNRIESKSAKDEHNFALECLKNAKFEMENGRYAESQELFKMYETYVDYKVEEQTKKAETKTDAFNEATKPLMEWLEKNCNPHHVAIVDSMGAQLMSGEIGVPSPLAIKYREEKENGEVK